MVFNLIDKKIREAFCDAAIQYDVLASLHREIGRELTKKIAEHEVKGSVLDIGMGTGWFTNRLKKFFPGSAVVGIDFAAGMIEKARGREESFLMVQGDAACLPFRRSSFSLLTSNLVYQWVKDLTSAYRQCYDVLNDEGRLCMTVFGYETFQELFACLEQAYQEQKKGQPNIQRLAKSSEIESVLMAAGFRDVDVTSEHIDVHFPDMMALLKWTKDIGANVVPRDFYVGKELLRRAQEIYGSQYSDRLGIRATFEVIWVEAVK